MIKKTYTKLKTKYLADELESFIITEKNEKIEIESQPSFSKINPYIVK
jgi:hypothetical protein